MNKGRKISGGKYHANRKKTSSESPGHPRLVKLGELKTKKIRGRAGHYRTVSLSQNKVTIIHNGKAQKATIKNVIETPQNRFLARQNILMKGVIIDTSLGKAKITNRPSQEGQVHAILIKE